MSFLWSSNSPSTEMKEKSDEEPKSKIVTKEAVEASLTNKSELKRAAKRPIESEEEDQKIETKKSKSAQKRNEIASSLSSSAVKKRQAEDLSSESDDESQTKKLKEDNSEENDQQLPLKQNPLKRQLKFESELSPKKMLKNVQHSVQTSSSDNENKNNVEEKELISDLKAFKADQERSEERGRRLMQAFDDD